MEGTSILIGSTLLLTFILVPGIAFTLAIFPRWRQITFIERMGMAVVFGMFPQLLSYFLNKNAGVEITSTTSILSVLLVTVAGLGIYYQRKAGK